MNSIFVSGRLTKEPAISATKNGTMVASFSIADQKYTKDDKGNYEVQYIQIIAWAKKAQYIQNNAGKGDFVEIIGRLQVRSYENKEKKRVYVTEVIADNLSIVKKPAAKPEPQKEPESQEA